MKILEPHKLAYLEANTNYTKVYYEDGGSQLHSYTLKLFQSQLAAFPQFVRTHRKYLVNRNHIATIGEQEVIMKCGKVIPIARRRSLV